jgi:hypothetical protein
MFFKNPSPPLKTLGKSPFFLKNGGESVKDELGSFSTPSIYN